MSEIRTDLPSEVPNPPPNRPELRIIDAEAPYVSHRPSSPPPRASWARRYRVYLRFSDSLIIAAAVLLAPIARVPGSSAAPLNFTGSQPYWAISILMILVWFVSLSVYHTRDGRIVGVGAEEYKGVVHASMLVFGLFFVAITLLRSDVALAQFAAALPLGVVGLTVSRWVWRKWLTLQRQAGRYLSRAIVVGGTDDVSYVISQMDRNPGAAYRIVGAALDQNDGGVLHVNGREVPVVCDLDTVTEAARQLRVDTVIVSGQPGNRGQYVRDLSWELEGTAAELVLANRLTNVAGPRIHFRPVEGLPLMHVELPRYEGGKHVLKRGLDITVSGAAILALLPLLLVLAALIRLDTNGPVLFRQERAGRGGKIFGMIKFRSMVVTAEDQLAGLLDQNEGAGVLFKMKNDPRVTRFGRVMRKYSLDELPQLWNILIGQMS
ncbi:MAG: polyprenyl glycosylphosphotransferase, partial [Homoserinimonas sp.]|nr:polyprenyl glycosylphosphotransferase [Homoserinimonas sp.]